MSISARSDGCWSLRGGLRISAACGLVFGLAITAALAQKADHQPGDEVEVDWAFKWQPAKVIEILPNGWIRVELAESQHRMKMTPVFPPDKVRPKTGAKPRAAKLNAAAKEKRTWADRTGRFKVEATLEEVKDGQVTLKRTDGRTVTLPIERLSQADQDFLKEAEKAAAEANPFEPAESMAPSADQAKQAPAGAGPSLTDADLSQVRSIAPGQPAPDWAWTPDTTSAPAELKTQALSLRGPQGNFFESPRAVVLSASSARAVIGHTDMHPGQTAATRFEWCDLAKARTLGCQAIPVPSVPLSFSPNGQRLAARSDGHMPGTKGRVDVWAVTDEKIEHLLGWTPSPSKDQFERDIVFADWTDNEHLVTVNSKGKLTLWKLDPLQAVYTIQLLANSRPALSSGGKYLAVMSSGGLEFYHAQDGQLAGRLAAESVDGASLCFRPDGAQLAVVSARWLMVWDLATGKLLRDIAVPPVARKDAVTWVADNYLLLGGTHLIDIERRIVLWEYSYEDPRSAEAVAALAGYLWFVNTERSNDGQRLVPCKLPHDEATAAAAKLDAESLLAVKPGVSVTLDIQVTATAEQQETIRQSLSTKLEQNGLKVAPDQPIQLVARVVKGETKEIEYHRFGVPFFRGREGDKVQYTVHRSELAFMVDGQTAWEAVSVASAPPILRLKEGQTAEQAVKEATQPNLNFFLNTKVPGYVARPTGRTSYGQSKLTPSGPVRVLPPGKPPATPTKKDPKLLDV